MKPEDFKDGDIVVCERGGRTIAGMVSVVTHKGISGVEIENRVLLHRRLPCGFVGFTHCENLRRATPFEARMITEMDVGLYVRTDDGKIVFGKAENQW